MTSIDLASMLMEPRRLVLPNPWAGHIPFASWLMRNLKPRVFVELGTHTGNSYSAFCQAIDEASATTQAFAVDTWQGDFHAGLYDDSVYNQLRAYHDPLYGRFSTLLRKTFDEALDDFVAGSIDLLHIDGLHTYEAVRHDFETWLPKLSDRGVVLFHDTCVYRDNFGVHRLWAELIERYPGFNFRHSNGLGVLLIGASRHPELLAMAEGPANPNWEQMRVLFARLGAEFELRLTNEFLAGRCKHLTQAIDERDAKSLQLHTVIERFEKNSAGLYEALNSKDATLKALYEALAVQEQQIRQAIEERGAKSVQLDTVIERFDKDSSGFHEALNSKDGTLKELYEDLADQNKTIAAQREELDSMLTSKSWQITRPLRGARRALDRRIAFARASRPARMAGMVRQQVRRHGVLGFWRRIPYYMRQLRARGGLLGARGHAPEFLVNSEMKRELRLHPELEDVAGLHLNVSVSVVIPTLNAGQEFGWLLQKLFAQKGVERIEIVVVDSGSRDGTVQIARDAGCVVVEILSSEFSHSYARNRGADEASGDYLLFMVQDAYPIGDYWMAGMQQYLLDHAEDKVLAASCSEYSRSDSDVMYDSMINTHYQFLGCLHYDRIGELREQGHFSLRSQGQLSDVSCMIGRETFQRYRYRGDYAEDLDLGIRLIQDGYRVAMLASVKVIHSHNRPAYYYFKRAFVDVVFLVDLFPDFEYARIESQSGLFIGILSVAAHLSRWLASPVPPEGSDAATVLRGLSNEWRTRFVRIDDGGALQLGDTRLDAWLQQFRDGQGQAALLHRTPDAAESREVQHFLDAFLGRLDHFTHFVQQTYGPCSEDLMLELRHAIVKTFGSTAGSALAFMYLDVSRQQCQGDLGIAQTIYSDLKAGV
jgi:glycosyltransferase involved in cell wall biosynthesis